MFVEDLVEKCIGKQFKIECHNIEVYDDENCCTPIFKGPGIIEARENGRLTYKIYNQIPINKDIFRYIRRFTDTDHSEISPSRFTAESYDNIKWNGSWTIPEIELLQGPYCLVYGEFDQLAAQIRERKIREEDNYTELVFPGYIPLPYKGVVEEKLLHGRNLVSISRWKDHHEVNLEDLLISFQVSPDRSRTHVTVTCNNQFDFPSIENWITEALIFVTAQMYFPRIIIRHLKDSKLVFLRSTPKSHHSNMPPPFSGEHGTKDHLWKAFCSYLSECKSTNQFEFLDITNGFLELCLASTGTLQGFLISIVTYIEFLVRLIFSENLGERDRDKIKALIEYVDSWSGDSSIKERAKGILSILYKPPVNSMLKTLIEQGVITETHRDVWKKTRPHLAHGKIITHDREADFWHYRNHLISMMYRLIFRIIGYKGVAIDYDGNKFIYAPFEWRKR